MNFKSPNPSALDGHMKRLQLMAAVRYFQLCKTSVVILCLICLFNQSKAQDTILTYLDDNWESATENDFTFYRKSVELSKSKWLVLDYYKQGNLQMSGFYTDSSISIENGNFSYFYENGNLESRGQYINGKHEKEWTYWWSNGDINKSGFYKEDKKTGIWKWYKDNGQICSKELLKSDSLVSATFYDESGKVISINKIPVEVMPEFPGGTSKMYKYLSKKLKYPKQMRRQGIQGIVKLTFIITNQGQVEGVRVLESVHPKIDQEAIRVINKMPDWSPGKQHNREVRVQFNLPIRFKLP